MSFSRRKFLTLAGASAAGVTALSPLEAYLARVASGQSVSVTKPPVLQPTLPSNAAQLTNTILGDLSQEAFLSLPPGFRYNVLSMTGMRMSDGTLVPAGHDGMAAFSGPNRTTILVRNHELAGALPASYNYPVVGSPKYDAAVNGGTTTLVLDRRGNLLKDFVSIAGTSTNCAGGPTPWGSWITCEETFSTSASTAKKHGYCFEVIADANSGTVANPTPIVAMGRFSHEAIAVDPKTLYVYETEDRGDSCFYRFIPTSIEARDQARRGDRSLRPGQLASEGGKLYALKIKNGPQNTTNNPFQGGVAGQIKVGTTFDVEWVQIDNVDPTSESASNPVTPANIAAGLVSVRRQAQAKGAAIFFRGEGCWYGNGLIYFVSTQSGAPAPQNLPSPPGSGRGNGQVWAYDPQKEKLTLVVEAASSGQFLDEPDNITVAPWGDLFLCEDSSDDFQYIVGVNQKGELYQFAQNTLFSKVANDPAKANFVGNEFAGACFSPDGQTLFVNVQTPGLTFAITGPWETLKRL